MAFTLPRAINITYQVDNLLELAGRAIGGEVRAERISWNFRKGIAVRAAGLSISGQSLPNASFCAACVHVKLALLPLITGRLQLREVVIDQPVLKWHSPRSPAGQPALVTGSSAPPSSPSRLATSLEIENFRVENGSFHLDFDRQQGAQHRSLDFYNVGLEAFHLSLNKVSPFRFQASLGESGSVAGDGQLGGPGAGPDGLYCQIHTLLKAIEAEQLAPFIRAAEPGLDLDGQASGRVDATYQAASARCEGELELGELICRDESRWPGALPGKRTRLSWELETAGADLEIPRFELHFADLALTARGRVEHWLTQPRLTRTHLRGDLPLRTARALVPWNATGKEVRFWEQVMAGGGEIQLQDLSLPDLPLDAGRPDAPALFRQSIGKFSVAGIRVPGTGLRPGIDLLQGQLELLGGNITSDTLRARTGAVALPPLKLHAGGFFSEPHFSLTAQGPATVDRGGPNSPDEALIHWGIREFSGEADVTLHLNYRHENPDPLLVQGRVEVRGLDITTAGSGSRLCLDGTLEVGNEQGPQLRLDRCLASINDHPLEMHGLISGVGTSRFLVDLELRADGVEVAPLVEVLPPLQASKLSGRLNANAAVNYARAEAQNMSLDGRVEIDGMHVELGGMTLEEGSLQLALQNNRLVLEKLQAQLNGQVLALRGNVSNLPIINASLFCSSPDLDIDRLIDAGRRRAAQPGPAAELKASEEATSRSLPPALQQAQLSLSFEIDKGWYRSQRYSNLLLAAKFNHSQLTGHNFDVRLAGGKLHTRGSADFTDLNHITFDTRYEIKGVQLEQFLPFIYDEPSPYTGPASSKGSLQGVIDSEFAESLRGSISIKAGPGNLPRASALGEALHDAMAFARLKGLLTGSMREFNQAELVPFEHFFVRGNFTEEKIDIPEMSLNTPGVKTDWKGCLRLADRTIDMDVEVSLLGSLDTALGLMPVLGETANKMSRIYLKLDGPLSDPRVEKTLWNSLEEVRRRPLQTLEKSVGKGLSTFRKFWH